MIVFKSLKATAPESRRFYFITILLTLVLTLFIQLQVHQSLGVAINRQIFHPLVFNIRSKLKSEKLDPRIKIFALDDSTVAYLRATDLDLEDWAKVIQALVTQPNTHLLVDKLFDSYRSQAEIEKFAALMKSRPSAKTGLIAFAHPSSIKFRESIPADLTRDLQSKILTHPEKHQNSFDFSKTMTLYGAPSQILKSFDVFGTANYAGDHYIDPLVVLKSGDIIPNAALSLIGGLSIQDQGISVAGAPVPLNREGKLLVNFQKPTLYRNAALSLLPVIARLRAGMDIPIIKPGDHIIILPAMYTGNTDFVDSPFGPLPGGFHLVAIIQSILANDWLREIEDPGLFVLLASIFGFFLGYLLRPSTGLGLILVAVLAVTFFSIACFVYFNLAISFILPVAGILVGGLNGVILNSHSAALNEARKSRELEVAALVQKSFFPTAALETIDSPNCKTIGIFESASECGGDWWGAFHKKGYTYTLIGDAVGHGVPAALITSIAFAVTRAVEIELDRAIDKVLPSDILMVLNKILISMGSSLTQMTFFVARINETTGECIYANAGNQPPYLIPFREAIASSKPRLSFLNALGNMLGEQESTQFQNHSITLSDGDKILMFTDGVYENRTANERSQVGKSWLRATIQEHALKPIDEFTRDFWSSYKKAIGSTPPDDDTTVVVIEFRKQNHLLGT